MQFSQTANFAKQYKKLPANIQKKVDKQIKFIFKDFYYPSLNTKRLSGHKNWWEFRVTRGYRMIAKKQGENLIFHAVGQHDTGLGKK